MPLPPVMPAILPNCNAFFGDSIFQASKGYVYFQPLFGMKKFRENSHLKDRLKKRRNTWKLS
jgi:hypothetical protein